MIFFLKKFGKTIADFWRTHINFRRAVAIFAILYGIIALVTPVLPGSWLIFVGLEIFGLKILFWQRFKNHFFRACKFVWGKRYWFGFTNIKKISTSLFRFLIGKLNKI